MLFEFEERDYEPIDRFRLLWRWTSPGHAELPRHVLDQIHPLTATNAALVNEYIVARTRRGYPGLADRAEFRDNHRQHDVPDANDSSTSAWLEALPIPAGESVIVCWDSQTAVAVPFGLVTRYWDDFFYPGSDDAAVVPTDCRWMLAWGHEARFEFGARHAERP